MNITPRMPRLGRVGPAWAGRVLAAATGTLALCGMLATGAGPAAAAPRTAAASRAVAAPRAVTAPRAAAAPRAAGLRRACPAVPAGQMRCFALYRPQYAVNRALAQGHKTHPQGWGPRALERAYRLPVSRGSHQTVAVSIAFRAPSLAKYLKVYREHYGLPPCTVASGCLRIVNQKGHVTPKAPSGLGTGWDLEATLDVSMISAACPHCRILVVQANDNSDINLARTDATAARLGADVISNSYGGRENGQTQTLRKDYLRPGHMVVASSGDFGFDAANFPANLGGVTAFGGTQLKRAPGPRGVTERVWNDPNLFAAATSSCSAYVAKPAWQHDRHCPGRTVADVSAVAADTPVFNAFYGGWVTVAGTSVSAPFISGVYGLAGNASSISPRHLYQHKADFFDITHGNNVLFFGGPAAACGSDYLCQAHKGYDAPTGLGTPDGIAGF
jgi:Subtilase family